MSEAVSQARHALLVLRYGIGDLVMELPALEQLHRQLERGGGRLSALGAAPAIELVGCDRRFAEVCTVQQFGFSHWGDWGSEQSRRELAHWVRVREFDLIIDPSHAPLGAGEVLWRGGTQFLDTVAELQNRGLRAGLPGIAAIREAVRDGWGVEVPPGRPRLLLHEDELEWADRKLRQLGLAERPLIAISPLGSSALKRWPTERFRNLARRLAAEGAAILAVGGPEPELARTLLPAGAPAAWVGPLHLRQVAAILARSRALVCNDTGSMHLAAALGTPVVAVFGPTHPAVYLPPEGVAAGFREDGCGYRRRHEFGPPECVLQDRCLMGAPCIERVDEEVVFQAACRHMSNPEETEVV